MQTELALGMGVSVSRITIETLMRIAGLQGIPKRKGVRNIKVHVTISDLVNRDFGRVGPNQLFSHRHY